MWALRAQPRQGGKAPFEPPKLGVPPREWKGLRPLRWWALRARTRLKGIALKNPHYIAGPGAPPLVWGVGTEGPHI